MITPDDPIDAPASAGSARLAARAWVSFSFDPEVDDVDLAGASGDRRDDYVVDAVHAVRGRPPTGPRPGARAVRREGTGALPPGQGALVATTQHLGYTDAATQAELLRTSRRRPGAVAVLIPIAKSEAWWALPQDGRQAHFASASGAGHTAIGARYAARIARRLFHARYLPGSEWDFLTYFEMEREDVGAFRELVAALRDPAHNPEWRYVEREAEIWMTKA